MDKLTSFVAMLLYSSICLSSFADNLSGLYTIAAISLEPEVLPKMYQSTVHKHAMQSAGVGIGYLYKSRMGHFALETRYQWYLQDKYGTLLTLKKKNIQFMLQYRIAAAGHFFYGELGGARRIVKANPSLKYTQIRPQWGIGVERCISPHYRLRLAYTHAMGSTITSISDALRSRKVPATQGIQLAISRLF